MKRISAVVLTFVTVIAAFGQEPLQTLKVNVELVQMYATVTDTRGRYVRDLKREHFQVLEDGVEQKLESFASDDVPVSAGVILDVGGSMKDNLGVAKEGAMTFLKAGHLDNEYFLVEFNDKAALTEEYTRDLTTLQNHTQFLTSEKNKAPYDGIHLGLQQLKDAINPRKILLVMTSGGYIKNQHKASEVRNMARQMDVQIFNVALPIDTDIHGEISDLAEASDVIEPIGGRNFVAADAQDYFSICRRIAVAVRNQYAITYRSTNPAHDGKFRKVQIKLNAPKGAPELIVQTRDGYYAQEP